MANYKMNTNCAGLFVGEIVTADDIKRVGGSLADWTTAGHKKHSVVKKPTGEQEMKCDVIPICTETSDARSIDDSALRRIPGMPGMDDMLRGEVQAKQARDAEEKKAAEAKAKADADAKGKGGRA